MRDYVDEALCFAGSHRPGVRLDKHADGVARRAAELPTTATGALSSFQLGIADETAGDLVPINVTIPIELSNEVNSCWGNIRGPYEPERAFAVVAAARVEYTRFVFFDLLSRYSRACISSDEACMESAKVLIAKTDWSNADLVSVLPHGVIFERQEVHVAGDTAAHIFRLWLQDFRPEDLSYGSRLHSHRKVEDYEVLDAMALAWLDAAPTSSFVAVELLSRAAGARFHAAKASGTRSSRPATTAASSERQQSVFSQLGHNARHARNREMKAAAISEFRLGDYRNKEAAAEHIAAKLGFAYSTVRNWLTNA